MLVTLGATTSTYSVKERLTNDLPSFQVKFEEVELTIPSTLDINIVKSPQLLTQSSIASVPKKRTANAMPDIRATKRRAVNQGPLSKNVAITSRDEPIRKKRGRPPKVTGTKDGKTVTLIPGNATQDAQAAVKQEPIDSSLDRPLEPVRKKRGRPPKMSRTEDGQITTLISRKAIQDAVKQKLIDPSLNRPLLSDSTQCHDTPMQHEEPDVPMEQEELDPIMDWEDVENYSHAGKPITQMDIYQESEQSTITDDSLSARAPTESRPLLPNGAWPHAWAQVFVFSSLRT